MQTGRALSLLAVWVTLACGGGGGGSNSGQSAPTAPPPPPPAAPSCKSSRVLVTAFVEPEASSCNTDNVLSIEVENGRCSPITLDSVTSKRVAPANGCGDLSTFTFPLGITLAPKETRTVDYGVITWCCNCGPRFFCAWKEEVVLETSVGRIVTESEFYRKEFSHRCRPCPVTPATPPGSGPEIGCEMTIEATPL